MRLHALIFALKAGRPVVGIGYDPKVTQLLAEFEQHCLILTKEDGGKDWTEALKTVASSLPSYSGKAESHAATAKKAACQNFDVLARILNMPRS
jgi:polysaccharide pyruvyl transferase WcaK-like protein